MIYKALLCGFGNIYRDMASIFVDLNILIGKINCWTRSNIHLNGCFDHFSITVIIINIYIYIISRLIENINNKKKIGKLIIALFLINNKKIHINYFYKNLL